MTSAHRQRLAAAVLSATALGGGGCGGGSGDDAGSRGGSERGAAMQVRAVLSEFQEAREHGRWRRACALLTPHAAAQLVAFVGRGTDDCEDGLRRGEPDDEALTPAQIARGSVRVRGDLALFVGAKDGAPSGFRRVDGAWRLDNVLNPSLVPDRARRSDPTLSEGSDEQQVRATAKAVTHAVVERDYETMCDLYGYGAEAQLFVAMLFTGLADDDAAADRQRAAGFSCADAVRRLDRGAGGDDGLAADALTDAQIDGARVTIRGDRATLRVAGSEPEHMVRQEGRWLVGPDPEGFG